MRMRFGKTRQGLLFCLRETSGSIAIETALGLMLMMTMVLGIMEFSMLAYTLSVVEDAAREGVRYASLHGADSTTCSGPSAGCTDSSGANVINDVKNYAASFSGNVQNMAVSVNYPDGVSTATSRVQVLVSYTYQPLFVYAGAVPTFHISSQGRIIY